MITENSTRIEGVKHRVGALDPLRILSPENDEELFAEATLQDIYTVDEVLSSDSTLTPEQKRDLTTLDCNLRLDWFYSKAGGMAVSYREFTGRWNRTDEFFRQARREAFRSQQAAPRHLWEVVGKTLDLHALMAYRTAYEARTTLAGTPQAEPAWQRGGNMLNSVILNATQYMMILKRHVNYDGNEYDQQQIRKKAVGTLGEATVLNYIRQTVHLDDAFGDVFPRMALEREDRFRQEDETAPKRKYDIVTHTPLQPGLWQIKVAGTTAEASAKNRRPRHRVVSYEPPIRPVLLEHFTDFRQHIPEYAEAFRIVANNRRAVTSLPEVIAARDRLNNRFANEVGDIYAPAA
jgi:hypothetical protein